MNQHCHMADRCNILLQADIIHSTVSIKTLKAQNCELINATLNDDYKHSGHYLSITNNNGN